MKILIVIGVILSALYGISWGTTNRHTGTMVEHSLLCGTKVYHLVGGTWRLQK